MSEKSGGLKRMAAKLSLPEELREQLRELTETLARRYRRDQHGIP